MCVSTVFIWLPRSASRLRSVDRFELCRASRCADTTKKRFPVARSCSRAYAARRRSVALSPDRMGSMKVHDEELFPVEDVSGHLRARLYREVSYRIRIPCVPSVTPGLP